jgi:ComF family protein
VLLSKTIINSKLTIEKVSNCSHHLSLTALGAATDYSNELVRELIFAFKYNKIVALKTPLSQLIISFLERTNWSTLLDLNWLVIPIPLHRRKYQLRGFNQSELLAQVVAQYFSLEISNKPLVRIKNNQAQASLKDKHSRLENAKGIFTISKPQIVHNRNILLIDDVITTGATMLEAAKILKGNKARQIIGLVLAKG